MSRCLICTLFVATWWSPVCAQNQVVQQPVVRQFRVGTSVSVPDGGRAFLGGVSQGATGTKRFGGPLRSGTNSGRESSNSSVSVSVQILDFEELDAAALQAARRGAARATSDKTPLNSRAAHAWRSLEAGHARR